MSRGGVGSLVLLAVCSTFGLAFAEEATTLFCLAAEQLPTCVNAPATAMEGAQGDAAVVLSSEAARLGAQLQLQPGAYAVVLRAFAPSAAKDALYIDVAGRSARLAIGEFERWVVRTQVFRVQEAAQYAVVLQPDPNELGLAIDQVALVRGAVGQLNEMADLPPPAAQVALEPVSGIRVAQAAQAGEEETVTPGASEFKMASLPEGPRGRGLDTLFYCSFDESRDADYARGNGKCALTAGEELVEGKWGNALDCTDQKVNMYFNVERNLIPRAGTLECWLKSGETNIWADGEDHCLFHLTPRRAMPGGPRAAMTVDLTKRGEDNAFHLTVTGGASADLAVPTADLDPQSWHHLAFSWDFTGRAPELWLCLDGNGEHATLAAGSSPLPFVALQIGNTRWYGHYAHANEFYAFGGLVDDLHISDETLARREAGHDPLDIGEIDLELSLAAEDALQRWLDKWSDLQIGGAWGDWISPQIAPNGLSLDWTGRPVDRRRVSNKYGSSAQLANYFLRAYEYTGDERWLQVAKNTGEFFLRGQDELGYWYQDYLVDESGRVAPAGATNSARIQDGYQSQRWLLMLYTHRVTGDQRYRDAATKCADFLLAIENPNGSWPGTYDTAKGAGRTTGQRGVEYGCEYNDCATSDPMRMMMTMYLLTGDEKYLKGPEGSKGIAGIGQWLFDTQIGEGEVRGWCQQYDHENKPVWARGFEAPVISPRVVNRFIHPMCVWMYLMTGNERYMNLLQETYDWYRAVEVPGPEGGWYYQYLPDGTPVYSTEFETIKIDPNDPKAPKPSREKLQLTHLERTLTQYNELGPEEFRQSFVGSVELGAEDYAQRRKSAAGSCRSQAQAVLEELKEQRADGTWVGGSWLRHPQGVRTYGYVLNLRLARGVVPPQALPRGGRSPWDGSIAGRGAWRVPVVWFADWFDIPLHE